MLAVVLAGAGVGTWLLLGGSEPELARGELFLEPATDPGLDAFTTSVATQPLTSLRPLPVEHAPRPGAAPTTPTEGEDPPAAALPGAEEADVTYVTAVEATRPGLYGGTRDSSSCDVEQLIAFLTDPANDDKAAAFAGVLDLEVAQLPTYLRGLTPVVLRADTLVINHGFRDGRATPRQAVLQAGTAVLVDQFGIPRVKCGCGNPLLPPVAPTASPTISGTSWEGFDLTQIITIVNVTNINITKFVLVDVVTDEPFEREPGAPADGPVDTPIDDATAFCNEYPRLCEEDIRLPVDDVIDTDFEEIEIPEDIVVGTGDVQVTLQWTGVGADLDLHVIDPNGEEIAYFARSSSSGGELDRDVIPSCDDGGPHIENVFWPEGGAPSGQYETWVNVFRGCGDPPQFTLQVRVGGQVVQSISGAADFDRSESIFFVVD